MLEPQNIPTRVGKFPTLLLGLSISNMKFNKICNFYEKD